LVASLTWSVVSSCIAVGGGGFAASEYVAIIVAAAAEARRGRALGLQSAAQAVGLSAGPGLGGFLIAALGWRWVFWINLPVGLLGAVLGLLVLPRTERPPGAATFDLAGAVLLVPSLGLLLFALNEAGHAGFRSPLLIGPILVGLLLLIGLCSARAAYNIAFDQSRPVSQRRVCRRQCRGIVVLRDPVRCLFRAAFCP
jgi:MFS family permease